MGNWGNSSFWHDKRIGLVPLRQAFPRLFDMPVKPNGQVIEMGD